MAIEKHPTVYIMASRYRGTIYVGVTSALWSRVCDHKNGTTPGFTSGYGMKTLVWYKHSQTIEAAIRREKQIKDCQRAWKIRLIEAMNPHWRDLHDGEFHTVTRPCVFSRFFSGRRRGPLRHATGR